MPSKSSDFKKMLNPSETKGYVKWMNKEHKKFWKFKPKNSIKKAVKNAKMEYSSVVRTKAYKGIKLSVPINSVDTICTVFKMKDPSLTDPSKSSKGNDEINYAFLYSEVKTPNTIYNDYDVISNSGKGPIIHKFFTTSPSFTSMDGEYRHRTVNFITVRRGQEELPNLWNEIENHLLEKIKKRKLILYEDYFYPTVVQQRYASELERSIDEERFAIKLYIVAWVCEVYNLYVGFTENHVNETYREIFYRDKIEDVKKFQKLIEKYGKQKVERLRELGNGLFTASHKKYTLLKMGQKIIPMNLAEVQNPINIKYRPWRENLITKRLSDLVVNCVSPGFSLVADWFYIKNSRKGLFDNNVQYRKLEHSEKATRIAEKLLEAQRATYLPDTIEPTLLRGNITEWISKKFQVLHDKIDEPIKYSKSDIIMSEVCLCVLSEYVGRTFYDVTLLSKKSKKYYDVIGQPFCKDGIGYFSKYMFELVYNLFCMNSKCGVIHGDLHLNNATIKPLYYRSFKDITKLNKSSVLYVVGENDQHQYLFPNISYFTCIIDFSRSIIDLDYLNDFKDSAIPGHKILNIEELEEFKNEQTERLEKVYGNNFPETYKKYKNEFRALLKLEFKAMFKLLTALDVYRFTRSFSLLFKKRETLTNVVRCCPDCMVLLNKMNKIAEYHLTTRMVKLIKNKRMAKQIEKDQFPNFDIIKQCFTQYEIPNGSSKEIDTNITDIFVYKNPLKYSLGTYNSFPPYIKNIKIITPNNEEKELSGSRSKKEKQIRLKYEEQRRKNLSMVNYIARRHKEKHF